MPQDASTLDTTKSFTDAWNARLKGADGRDHTLASLAGARATIVIFTGNSCPTVRAYEDRLMALRARREQDGVLMVAVNPNNPHLSPSDTLAEMVHRAAQRHFNFPYLKDADGAVAKAFGATCTPHAFVVNADGEVVYSGRIDDSRVGDRVTSEDLENAVDDIVAGRPLRAPRTDPFGCATVW